MKELCRPRIEIAKIEKDHTVDAVDVWNIGNALAITKYWSGEEAPPERHAAVRIHWSENALYVRFDCVQSEPLVVSSEPRTDLKTVGLWDRDVCEIFIAPNISHPEKYYEFEVAPTGEWIDLAIVNELGSRKADLEYDSKFESFASIEEDRVVIAMKIGWNAFGQKPAAGDVWLGNLFRCIGSDPTRGYLAFEPTLTEAPNFHIPESFVEMLFV